MTRSLLPVFCMLFLSACCHKKKCADDFLPGLTVQFRGVDPGKSNTVKLYTVDKNGGTDSVQIELDPANPILQLSPFSEMEGSAVKSYKLQWKDNTQEITDMHCNFREQEIKCNKCYPFGSDRQTVTTFSKFSYRSGDQTFVNENTLFLNY